MSLPSAKHRSLNRTTRSSASTELLSQESFRRMLSQERRRSERSQRPFVLLLIDTDLSLSADKRGRTLLKVLSSLQFLTRETDEIGWYELNASIGVMFTEVVLDDNLIVSTILSRISAALRDKFVTEEFSQIRFSCHLFPEEWERRGLLSEKDESLALGQAASGTSEGQGRLPS